MVEPIVAGDGPIPRTLDHIVLVITVSGIQDLYYLET